MNTLEFVKVTEAAALAASRWMGKGQRDLADGAAVEKMREVLNNKRAIADGIIQGLFFRP